MRCLRLLLLFVFACLLGLGGMSSSCFADNSYSVYAKVPTMSTVVVNKHGTILKILSNSFNKSESIEVRLNSEEGTVIGSSSKIINQYYKLTDGMSNHPGVIYALNTSQTKPRPNDLVSVIFGDFSYGTIAAIHP